MDISCRLYTYLLFIRKGMGTIPYLAEWKPSYILLLMWILEYRIQKSFGKKRKERKVRKKDENKKNSWAMWRTQRRGRTSIIRENRICKQINNWIYERRAWPILENQLFSFSTTILSIRANNALYFSMRWEIKIINHMRFVNKSLTGNEQEIFVYMLNMMHYSLSH